ncbi:kinesin-like protein KIN-7C, mitochondrial isoform X2 [Rosa rugosa]|uniref:kinesin-like protein KIN-7C, mitochondrial isoform X2 n=1 Tax=Rosa rugosa TaxID=74645 RepID=UPI002B41702D|nr:kinesin-like protein KIN-7C, mitochondrial isoform X2 [Rosa rugosa]XP_062021548.1 kinesin-like protein KIN-7C, mitochondrial isoform X2 [Rosa rugosa]
MASAGALTAKIRRTKAPLLEEVPKLQRLAVKKLAYLPDKKREYVIDDDALSHASELSVEGRDDITNLDELVKDYKRNRRRGMLGWLKLKSKVGDRLHTSMDVS